jgi:hypothetical protein
VSTDEQLAEALALRIAGGDHGEAERVLVRARADAERLLRDPDTAERVRELAGLLLRDGQLTGERVHDVLERSC